MRTKNTIPLRHVRFVLRSAKKAITALDPTTRQRSWNVQADPNQAVPAGAFPLECLRPIEHRPSLPLSLVLAVIAAYVFTGLVGHDPWKQDETYIFSIIDNILRGGDWIVPLSAGHPFMEKPPLYYLGAAFMAKIFSPWLPAYDGARLATGIFMATGLTFVALSARKWWGPLQGRIAALALLGCFGLVYESHLMITDIPMLAGYAIATFGFSQSRDRPIRGGLFLGTGIGVAFLAKGLLVPSILGLTVALLPAIFKTWRSKAFARAIAIALLTALPWLIIWPTALFYRSPALFHDWFWINNIGRFFGFSVASLGAENKPWFWFKTLPWFSFPVLPLAVYSVWRFRAQIKHSAGLQFGIVSIAIYFSVLVASASGRSLYGLPMLISLAILATPGVSALSPQFCNGSSKVLRVLFSLFATLIWVFWIFLLIKGHAPNFRLITRSLPLTYKMEFSIFPFLAASTATFGAIWIEQKYNGLRQQVLTSLALGVALCWILFSTLLMPWFDSAKSLRSVFAGMQPHLPKDKSGVVSLGFGESESAMMYYYCGILADPFSTSNIKSPQFLVIYGKAISPPQNLPRFWTLVWNGARTGDNDERYWLFSRRN